MSDQDAKPFFEALHATLRDTNLPVRTAGCPAESIWYKLAGGEAGGNEETELLDHASDCRYCAVLLREAIEDLHTDTTSQEAALLYGLRAIDLPASRAVPAGLVNPAIAKLKELPHKRSYTTFWRWTVAAGLLLACAIGVWKYAFPAWAVGRAESLLAEGEAWGRLSEFRLSDAPYAPVHVNRSGAEPVPAEFVRALDWARRAGDQPRARVLQARIRIAGGAPVDVTDALDNAAQTVGADASLLNDIAVSLAIKAAKHHDPAAAGRALAAADKALSSNSSFAPALYNRALILQLLDRNDDACQTLATFLRIETDPRWREEARARITCLRR